MSTVVVACGGRSLEQRISRHSGSRVGVALEQLGHRVEVLDVDATTIDALVRRPPDFTFVAMHGSGGEDGTLQNLLEVMGLPYTGSDAPSSALCLDKHLFKSVCRLRDIPTPPWFSYTKQAFAEFGAAATLTAALERFPDGVIVKPAREGSSLGVQLVQDAEALRGAILAALSYDDRVLLERYVPGRELAVTVMGPTDAPRTLPIVEIRFPEPVYSFSAHYDIGTAEVSQAQLEPALQRRVQDVAAAAYTAGGCRDFARVDIRLEGDEAWILEINTIPGLTETGPAPLAAELDGMSFEAFVEAICERVQRAASGR